MYAPELLSERGRALRAEARRAGGAWTTLRALRRAVVRVGRR
jgi:hypothetical protein